MNTTFDELSAPPTREFEWMRPRPDVLDANENETITDDQRAENAVSRTDSPDQVLLKLFYEWVLGTPRLADVQPVRVWLCSPGNHPVSLPLPGGNAPGKHPASIDLPLDDAVADWVWENQRPLTIVANKDYRFPNFARLLLAWDISYFCAVPLMLANRRIGILGLASASREALRNFDLDFAQRGAGNFVALTKKENAPGHQPESPKEFRGETSSREKDGISENNFEGIIGRSTGIAALCEQIKVFGPTSSTVLVLGETGSGKERFAQAIHNLSPRRNRPFIKVNCAAIPAGLIESELFGHERGAFTGAIARRAGRFEMADGGTLFLDEIGDIPLELQPKLLRVLQEQEFERVGSTQTTRVNVRIVAATSRDLPRMVAARQFRADLYYRLNVCPLRVPALRDRPEDIPLLVRHFVDIYSAKTGKRVTEVPAETMGVLLRYPWPGNVRELQNVIERAVILSPGKVLQASLDELQQSPQTNDELDAELNDNLTTLKDVEREHIIRALAATNWVLGGPKGAGARLGLPRTTLIAKMQKLGITRAQA
jgi:formate hydrogenlyase transcriptional activator